MSLVAKKKKGNDEDFNFEDMFDDLNIGPRTKIPTGLPLLDRKLGGGIPDGVFVEAYGPPFCGKTSLGYSIMGQIQKQGLGRCVLFDIEESFNEEMALRCGLDPYHLDSNGDKSFYMTQKAEDKIIESVFNKIKKILYTMPSVRFIMIDSVAGMIPGDFVAADDKDTEITQRYGMVRAGVFARLLPELQRWLSDTGSSTIIYFVNHEKEEVGFSGHGPTKTTTSGGKSWKYIASMRLEFRIVKQEKLEKRDIVADQTIKETDRMYIRCQATKNRYGTPFKSSTFIFDVGEGGKGFDHVGTVLPHAYAMGLINKGGGGNYTVPPALSHDGSEVKIKGGDTVVEYYENHPEAFSAVVEAVLANTSNEE